MKKLIFIFLTLLCGHISLVFGQTANDTTNIPILSSAPISFRVNESGSILHGYYKKGYNLTIYGNNSALGYRADCDKDDDWSGATARGTRQTKNNFESVFNCVFDPHKLYGTVLPGNNIGQNHYDKLKNQAVGVGDLTLSYKLDKNNKPIDSIIGVVFDRGPHNQPGESSVATCDKFKSSLDNNQFIYIVFPNTAKYVKETIGTKPNTNKLKRNPTNSDFELAYKLMLSEIEINKRIEMQKNILKSLSQIAILSNFDNATPQEKAEGKLKPKNNDRNLNE
jgi:hypothetical protein